MKTLTRLKDWQAANFGIVLAVGVCLAILAMGTWLTRYELAQPPLDDVGFFYEWKLAQPDFWSRATVWIGFVVHQVAIWFTIWWAQDRSSRKYTDTLKPVNLIALGINVVFIILHYLQTAFLYDGIAQDIPSWTAQGAVIMMLYIIMTMENRRRGMFFGRKLNFRKEFYDWLKRYHGYAFSFAVIYTFWFHPMVPTWGHLLGFVHVILVMVQGSLMFTRMHLNRRWIVLLEILVLPHAALVAINQGGGLVYMFVLGFAAIFIVTQMHGLGLKPWVKNLFGASFALTVFVIYAFIRQPFQVNEVIRIPFIEYGLVFVTYWLWLLFARLAGKLNRFRANDGTPLPTAAGD
ncbi:MAG: hypothetical protein HZC41_23970 [Chloroflexi bacterium]|nr:hypothetical protein [Chloroflexota bacterium]